ncbi:hypothetical protein BLNAU_6591 [Blattamonas nauphoetae]|uniref:Uncharacterized protein n=1 Tax=Blattamonas nauphoetae TaxID=2049346 RepID=A0ABQ9Y479_9EUKA|nr:hypothetical protein BLNAU_6591 [Blattamonas nauphoetae]
MFEYSFGLQTQEVVELLTFKTFELQLLLQISRHFCQPEQAPNVHGFASFSGLLFENRWEDFIRVNEAILAVVERVQRKTRLDGSELAFPPLIRADILSEVTSTLLKVVKKDRRTYTQTCVNGFVSLLQNWQLTLTGITSLVHLFHTLLHSKDPRL